MLKYFTKRRGLGIEILPGAVRLAAVRGSGARASVIYTKTAELPAGMVTDGFGYPNISDQQGLSAILAETLRDPAFSGIKKAGLSLPDGIFRVQSLEFDDLPGKRSEIERLVRWRLEKAATFDMTGASLRFQVFRRQDKRFSVLACAARQDVLSEYENLILGLGLEPWAVGISSLNTLNFYFPHLRNNESVAFAYVSDNYLAVAISEYDCPRFYRFKEIKKGASEDVQDRLVRELDDSIHFYMHMDRAQPSGISHLCLAGDYAGLNSFAENFKATTPLQLDVLSPASAPLNVDARRKGEMPAPEMAAALGAGVAI